jgi:beta-lactamase superfamily II metal-dependent hydrolase
MTPFRLSDKAKFLIVLGIVLFEITFVYLTKDQPRIVEPSREESVTIEVNDGGAVALTEEVVSGLNEETQVAEIREEVIVNPIEEVSVIDDVKHVKTNPTNLSNGEALEVHYLDVGQADAIYIGYGDFDMVIDGGNNEDGPYVVSYLEEQGVDTIELMIASHAHEDHIGGLDNVLDAFEVEMVIDSGQERETKTYKDYMAAAIKSGAFVIQDDSRVFTIDDHLQVEIIEVVDDQEETNNNSVVARVIFDDVAFLFTGDLEEEVEQMLLMHPIQADVFKAGHHGSSSSNTDMFLRRVQPEIVIISAGLNNKYGHPHKEALERLLKQTDKIYGTWENGTIMVKTDGKSIQVDADEFVTMEDAHASGEVIESNTSGPWWHQLFK